MDAPPRASRNTSISLSDIPRLMPGWCVDKIVRVRAKHMASPVVLENCKEVDGSTFFHLKKSCDCVMKLLGHPRSKGARPLANTSICEVVERLRDDAYKSSLATAMDTLGVHDVQDGSLPPPGSRSWKRKFKGNRDRIHGSTVTVHGPTMGEIKGIAFKVVVDRPGTPLYVQLEEDLVTYLKECADFEISSGTVHRQHPSDRIPTEQKVDTTQFRGLSFSYVKQQFALRRAASDGKVHVRYITANSASEAMELFNSDTASPEDESQDGAADGDAEDLVEVEDDD